MMGGGRIYLRAGDDYVPMTETPYPAEDVLQKHLADLPDLLAGDQMTPSDPRRWLLVEREVGVPDSSGAPDRWSLDHLFLDQDAISTFVEVKRSSNTQIRREVVGQMLDYAANATVYWPPGRVRSLVEERLGPETAATVRRLLRPPDEGPPPADDEGTDEVESYWELVDENLARRRLRLLFAADEIPRELVRIIEFLNENMHDAEVYGIEVHQYVGEGVETLVPRLIGQTAAALDQKHRPPRASRERRDWDLPSFLQACKEITGPDAGELARSISSWADERGLGLAFGTGKFGPMYVTAPSGRGSDVKLVNMNTAGYLMIGYDALAHVAPFDESDARLELNRRLNLGPGIDLDDDYARRASHPGFHWDVLSEPATRSAFLDAVAWAASEIRKAETGTT